MVAAKRIGLIVATLLVLTTSILPTYAQGSVRLELEPAHKLEIDRLSHIYQSWNNCGGATVSMGLSYYGYPASERSDQFAARDYLKPNDEDQNVSPWQLVDYVNLWRGRSTTCVQWRVAVVMPIPSSGC